MRLANKGFFNTLMCGDFGLAKTYWLYGVVVQMIGNMLLTAVAPSLGATLVLILHLALMIYWVVAAIGTWRAADRYQGNKLWPVLAKVAIVLGFLTLFGIVAGSSLFVMGLSAPH